MCGPYLAEGRIIDFGEPVFEVGFAFIARGLEGGIAEQQPIELNPLGQFARRYLDGSFHWRIPDMMPLMSNACARRPAAARILDPGQPIVNILKESADCS